MVQEGRKAPAFTAVTDEGSKVSLKEYAGQIVVLYFYPKDMTPGCTTEAQCFRDDLPNFTKQGVVVLGCSPDSVERHVKFKEKYNLNFPLLSDPEHVIAEKYGVWQEKKMYGKTFMGIVRSTFIIDANGKIARIFSKVKVKDHTQAVLDALS